MIAHLERHDPVAPVEIWIEGDEPSRLVATGVIQITPGFLNEHGLKDWRGEPKGALPVVIGVKLSRP